MGCIYRFMRKNIYREIKLRHPTLFLPSLPDTGIKNRDTMVNKTLKTLAFSLSGYLQRKFNLQESIALPLPLGGTYINIPDNKLHVTLINIERETAAGIAINRQPLGTGRTQKGAPAWLLNLYIIISAVFQEKQYQESLDLLSAALVYLQSHPVVDITHPQASLAIEPVNLSFNELSNIWGICGGTYYPAICCKIRVLSVDGQHISEIRSNISERELNI